MGHLYSWLLEIVKGSIIIPFLNFGKSSVLADVKRFDEAEKALSVGLAAAQRLDNKPLQIAGHFYEGYLNLAQHNLKPAKAAFETTLEQAKNIKLTEFVLIALVHLIEVYLLEYRATLDEKFLESMHPSCHH